MTIPGERLACWLKSDAGTFQDAALSVASVADGDPVGGWADQSGNGFNAFQSVALRRPSFKLNLLNGLPALRFDPAAKQFLSLGTVLGKPRSWSLFIVMATDAPNLRQFTHGSVNSAGSTPTSWGNAVISQNGCPAGSSSPDFGDETNYSQSVTPGGIWAAGVYNLMSYVQRDNSGGISVFKNGSAVPCTHNGVAYECKGRPYNFSLGREGDVDISSLYFSGWISEFILYDVDLLPFDRACVEAVLKTKWGL